MKLQRTTLVLILLALSLGGFVYFYETRNAAVREATQTKQKEIFTFNEDQIQALTIKKSEQTLRFERVDQTANKASLSRWRMKVPNDSPASDAAVSFLLNLLVDGKSEQSLTVKPAELQEYGLDKPQTTVEVELKDKTTHQLMLGKPNFNRSSLYAQVDPPAQKSDQLQILLVPIDFEYSVDRPLSEWQESKEDSKSDSDKKPGEATDEGSPSPSSSPKASEDEGANKPQPKASDQASPSPSP